MITPTKRKASRKLFGTPPKRKARMGDIETSESESENVLKKQKRKRGKGGKSVDRSYQQKKRRKGIVVRNTSLDDDTKLNDALPAKLRGKWTRSGNSPSTPLKRKPSMKKMQSPVELEHAVERIRTLLQHFLSAEKTRKWCLYEWFYSDIDKLFFEFNEFQVCLDELKIEKTKLSRVEWSYIRQTYMGKPRRFSTAFLRDERRRLNLFRENVRRARDEKSISIIGPDGLRLPPIKFVVEKLPVGSPVLAFNSDFSMHRGTVVEAFYNTYKIEFDNPLLGTKIIPDTDVRAHHDASKDHKAAKLKKVDYDYNSPFSSVMAGPSLRHLTADQVAELEPIVQLLRHLNSKEKLIALLTKMNNDAEKMSATAGFVGYPEPFKQEYALVVLQLHSINKIIKQHLLSLNSSSTVVSSDVEESSISSGHSPNSGGFEFFNLGEGSRKEYNGVERNSEVGGANCSHSLPNSSLSTSPLLLSSSIHSPFISNSHHSCDNPFTSSSNFHSIPSSADVNPLDSVHFNNNLSPFSNTNTNNDTNNDNDSNSNSSNNTHSNNDSKSVNSKTNE